MWFNGCLFVVPALGSDSHGSGEDIYRTGSNVTLQIACRMSSGFMRDLKMAWAQGKWVTDDGQEASSSSMPVFYDSSVLKLSASDCVLAETYRNMMGWLLLWERRRFNWRVFLVFMLFCFAQIWCHVEKAVETQLPSDQMGSDAFSLIKPSSPPASLSTSLGPYCFLMVLSQLFCSPALTLISWTSSLLSLFPEHWSFCQSGNL